MDRNGEGLHQLSPPAVPEVNGLRWCGREGRPEVSAHVYSTGKSALPVWPLAVMSSNSPPLLLLGQMHCRPYAIPSPRDRRASKKLQACRDNSRPQADAAATPGVIVLFSSSPGRDYMHGTWQWVVSELNALAVHRMGFAGRRVLGGEVPEYSSARSGRGESPRWSARFVGVGVHPPQPPILLVLAFGACIASVCTPGSRHEPTGRVPGQTFRTPTGVVRGILDRCDIHSFSARPSHPCVQSLRDRIAQD